jgi:hypothetical protein
MGYVDPKDQHHLSYVVEGKVLNDVILGIAEQHIAKSIGCVLG